MTTIPRELFFKPINFRFGLFILFIIGSYVISYFFFFLPVMIPPVLFNLIVVIAALPSLFFFYHWAGAKNSSVIISLLIILTLFIEGMGVLTGFPYGHFFYSDLLGIKILGLVPFAVPFAFIPLVLGTVSIVIQYLQKPWKIILLSTFLLVIIDFIIDPILVYLGIWIWITPGFYYGVPLSNFIGWVLTGLVVSTVLVISLKMEIEDFPKIPITVAISLFFTLTFWSGFALWTMLLIPFMLSIILLGFLLITFYYNLFN